MIKKNFSESLQSYQSSSEQQISNSSIHFDTNDLRSKRANDPSLVEATTKKDYTYWLSQEDIADIARLEYGNYKGKSEDNTDFEVLDSFLYLSTRIKSFQSKVKNLPVARLTLILNLENLHWVTLVIFYKKNSYIGYYIDSKNKPMPHDYNQLLFERQIQPMSLSPGFPQQSDDYNCGLWALENAADLNGMLNDNQPLYEVIAKFKCLRDREYFNTRRELLAEKIRIDSVWRDRHSTSLASLATASFIDTEVESSSSKRIKTLPQQKSVSTLLDTFVEAFISSFMNRLAAYHVIAKGERLTEEAIKAELKTGITGALLGIGISQSIVGSIPSLVASFRTISGKYYFSKGKAQKITKIFSPIFSGDLSLILSEAAVNIFFSFESQFMCVTDKAGDKMAMEKLSEDAAERVLNSIERHVDEIKQVSKELIEQSVLQGPSGKFFDPSVKEVRLSVSGYIIQDSAENNVNTANLYEKIGLVVLGRGNQPAKYYINQEPSKKNQYGYRRLLSWEKKTNGELIDGLINQYIENKFPQQESIFQFASRQYHYELEIEMCQLEAHRILFKIENRVPQTFPKQQTSKNSILFDLKKPIGNFTGRIERLIELHRVLMSGRTAAIVPGLSTLSIDSASGGSSIMSGSSISTIEGSSGLQISISGLGGIGKTQLALRYAELYAKDYDYNVLWMNAETKENLSYSFNKLATKLQLMTQDRYGQKRSLEEIVEEVYEYFSDRKSLFIFDNVENYRTIERYLPQSMLGNKPTILITSRYSNWSNVASVLSLDTFTHQEAEDLIKKSLSLKDNTQDERIKELNQLLQGLPLALQQAIAYIKLRKESDIQFSIHDYMELYKEKSKELLNFDFSNYSNDPYMKTVFTTWLVTLEKIKAHPIIGEDAIEILNMMAYFDPENISNNNFYYLKHVDYRLKDYSIASLMHLLKNYSMLNTGRQEGKYTIHRLVQQVIRINLEANQAEFEKIVEKIQRLFVHYTFKNEEENFHYLHFLLYMSEHTELSRTLLNEHTEKLLFDKLAYQDIKYWFYFTDLAYFKFSKERYLKFIGDGLAYCVKSGLLILISEMLNYIEKKWKEKIFSKENLKFILEHVYTLKEPAYSLTRLSGIPEKKQTQLEAIRILYEFKVLIFGDFDLYTRCPSHSLKRQINPCFLSENENSVNKIRDKNFKSHVEKIGQFSHWLNARLMGKDILSALVQGHFAEVAVNAELITSSLLLGKLSNSLFMQGKTLVADASVLDKDLGLANKKALHILFNEELLSIGKRQFLGKTLQVAAPFVARGTSIYFAYNLNQEIQAYKRGDKTILLDIISNGIIVGVDGIEAGVEASEFFGIITGISEFTGPIGEGVVVLAWLGVEAYDAKQQVKAIEKYVHLSGSEEFIQGLRAFFHLAPSRYLEIKINNNQMIKNSLNFLKIHPEISHYVFPLFYSATDTYTNSSIFLDQKREIIVENEFDTPNEVQVFCFPGLVRCSTEKPTTVKSFKEWRASPPLAGWPNSYDQTESPPITSYFCGNAIGVEYSSNQTETAILFDLGKGKDQIISFSNRPALFIVKKGEKYYQGGHKGNLFILETHGAIKGLLQGGNETDSLQLSNFQSKKNASILLDAHGFLCKKQNEVVDSVPLFCPIDDSRLKLDSINQIYGRKNQQDIIYLNQDIQFVDGYGGRNKKYPDSFFVTDRSYKNPTFCVRNNTVILVSASTGIETVTYRIPAEEVGEAQIQFPFAETVQHRFFFACPIQNLQSINAINNTMNVTLHVLDTTNDTLKLFTIDITDIPSNQEKKNVTDYWKHTSYFFSDMEMKLFNNKQLFAQERIAINNTIEEKIDLLSELAVRLDKSLFVQLLNNVTLSIGRGKHEVFYNDARFEKHLLGNGGENVYVIMPGNDTSFPLPEVVLYDIEEKGLSSIVELRDTLDVREVVKKFIQLCPESSILPVVYSLKNDLILSLNTRFYFSEGTCVLLLSTWPLMHIKLKNALLNLWYQKLDIFLKDDTIPRRITLSTNDNWQLTEAPLVFTDDKKIIVITDKDIGESAEIILLRNIGNYSFFRNDTDLIISNAITATSSFDYCTIICYQFYILLEMKKKVLSTVFNFFDQVIYPQEHQEKINQAANFSEIVSRKLINFTINPSFNLTELPDTSFSAQKNLSQPLDRSKRQIDSKENSVHEVFKSRFSKQVKRESSQRVHSFHYTPIFDKKEDIILAAEEKYLAQYEHQRFPSKLHPNKNNYNKNNKKKAKTNLLAMDKQRDNPFHINYEKSFFNSNKKEFILKRVVLKHNKFLSHAKPSAAVIRESYQSRGDKKDFYAHPKMDTKKRTLLDTVHQFSHKRSISSKSIYPSLTYQQNKSGSKKTDRQLLSHVVARSDFNETLLFLKLVIKPCLAPSFTKKCVKNFNKLENQNERFRSKILGLPRLNKIEITRHNLK